MVETTSKEPSCRRVARPRKGVGTLIAAAFMILILLLGFSVFFLMRTGAEDYQETVESMNRLDFERSQEKAEITYFAGGVKNLTLVVENTGSIEFELALIGVFDRETLQPLGNTYTPISGKDVLFRPGESRTIGPYIFTGNERKCFVQLTTKRGTVISEEYPKITDEYPWFFMQSGVGWITIILDPYSINITTPTNSTPTPAWTLDKSDVSDLMFWVKFRNHAPEDLELLKWSYIELTIFKTGSVGSVPFYIVDNESTAGSLVAYGTNGNITLPRPDCCGTEPACNLKGCDSEDWMEGGNTTIVKFAAKDPGEADTQSLSSSSNNYNLAIMLYYGFREEVIGQFIPFAGIRVE